MTKHRLFLIGMGPGTAEWMTLAAWNRITKVSYIFASERLKDMLVNELAERLAFDHSQYQWRIFDGKLTAMVEPLLADLQKVIQLYCVPVIQVFLVSRRGLVK